MLFPFFIFTLKTLIFYHCFKTMIHIISPAKSLDFKSEVPFKEFTIPSKLGESEKLINKLRRTSKKGIKTMMSISDNLVELNVNRYDSWQGKNHMSESSKQALFAFSGDVYLGLDALTLTQSDVTYAQNNLRILSGLYGVLKPLDVIEPYRLEMGSVLKVGRKNNLYEFWGDQLAKELNEEMKSRGESALVNLASNEYFKAVNQKLIEGEIINPQFLDEKNGKFKIISFFAKKARGLMSRYIIENRVETVEDLKGFYYSGYVYNEELSDSNKPVFTRK